MNLISVFNIFSFVICIFIGSMVYNGNRNEKGNLFAAICFLTGWLFFTKYNLFRIDSYKEALLWTRLGGVWYFWISLEYNFLLLLLSKEIRKQTYIFLYLPPAIFYLIHISTELLVYPIKIKETWTFTINWSSRISYFMYTWQGVLFILICITLIRSYFKIRDKRIKKQINIFILVIVIPYFLIVIMLTFVKIQIINIIEMIMIIFILVIMGYITRNYKMFMTDEVYFTEKIINTMEDSVIIMDMKYKIVDMNQRAEKMFEMPLDLVRNRGLDTLFHKEKRISLWNNFLEIIMDKGLFNDYEVEIFTSRKDRLYVSVSGSVIKDKFGDFVGIVLILRDVSLRKKIQDEIRLQATVDDMTKMIKRKIGLKILEEEMKKVIKDKKKLTICYSDINGLKEINDRLGHCFGDDIIITVAAIIKNNIRRNDITIRMGGDEFLTIFKDCDYDDAIAIWERVNKKIKEVNDKENKKYLISISCGFAEYSYINKLTIGEFIAIADAEMYKDKRNKKSKELKTVLKSVD